MLLCLWVHQSQETWTRWLPAAFSLRSFPAGRTPLSVLAGPSPGHSAKSTGHRAGAPGAPRIINWAGMFGAEQSSIHTNAENV